MCDPEPEAGPLIVPMTVTVPRAKLVEITEAIGRAYDKLERGLYAEAFHAAEEAYGMAEELLEEK